MAGLLEIANVPRMVNVLGKDVDVFGISGRAVAALMARFPAVGKMFSGIEVQKEDLYKMGPEVIAALIAAGCGKPGDPAAEEFAANLGVGDQLDLLDEILRLTFPRGVGPFVEKLEALGLLAYGALEAKTQSQRTSQPPSSNSSPPVTAEH
jgi:hypothetical protein